MDDKPVKRGMVSLSDLDPEPEDDSAEIIDCFPTDEIRRVSELVTELQKIISRHGDLPIIADANGDMYPFSGYCLVVQGGKKKVAL